jgi:ABC-type phosphate/phosphonate transport system substrate-binding protein
MHTYEPLRTLLSDETRRPVVLHAGDEQHVECDIFIMSTHDFLAKTDGLGVEAIYEIRRTAKREDSAILIARSPREKVDYSQLSAADIVFSSPHSVNGFWMQLAMLAENGFQMPASSSDFRFAGGDGDQSRVILGVVYGAYRLGACRLSDVALLTERGVIDGDEIAVLERRDALPETVIAVRPGDARYYAAKLKNIARLVDEAAAPVNQPETVRLLKSYGVGGLEPVDGGHIRKAGGLLARATGDH